ncbi:centromere-associated protein E isoform X2 [Boleophthalmus pectinirostris]|uniref:centromere-associated protein E isoform X2 n=1 Tax=Boleophthalmus pectinirostris TaxID=150288 RepID=UPI00242E7521|nr:centromere-associated protein E isoform X2 [Boleophthalmus pectinirostris]
MAEDSAVKVCVRVRPLIEREENAASENAQQPQLFWRADNNSVHQINEGASVKSFSFDHVFTAHETTDTLYQTIAKPLVVSTVQGYNGTIFAYGQTSSGKTFTMMGCDKTPGVIPLAVEDVFQTIQNCPKKEFLLRVSYMEIYNETVSDLLVDSWKRKPLEVRETLNKNIYVADLTEELVTSPAQALHWIRLGEKNRHYGKTKMNQRSSRSHTIFRMILESRERSDSENADGAIIVSHLNLVDLAGSERASQTGAEGARFKEGCNINRSLFTLGQVIKKLTDESQSGFTNYRDSKLTRILQNSLGGNAKTVIICTITPVAFDETLSTLQFASTAKKMKNDPHVTEVSDDGALLKRYRNEIVDLKRRLLEVSSVTQTTATEKELLSQLLQEKDQLQREQEDRIRNLTNLLVSYNPNQVTGRRAPKRRVTWSGKMIKQTACPSAESSIKKRKANYSCIEPDEAFYPHWEILDEAPEDLDISQASITIRSLGDSPQDFGPPEHLRELSQKIASLEQQLQMESSQKSEAQSKLKALDDRVAELELQLQRELQLKQDASQMLTVAQQREAELDVELRAQTEEQMQLEEKMTILQLRIADLEKGLQEPTDTEDIDQVKRQFSEAIQLCETLASEKDVLLTERNYLKEELGLSLEQIKTLEKENANLSQELEEKRETDEFENLEEQIRKDNEDKLQEEISKLKTIIESSEQKQKDLQNELEALSVELKKKCDFIEELKIMKGKDLVQEVTMLQRSLDDAEKISMDTKKEWACLRSQNIALEEKNVTLALNNEKNENEVTRLHSLLEMEKSKFKKMQFDLQKELNIAFEENIKLSTLLDGKIPKNMIDNVDLERTVTKLRKELTTCQEASADLQVKLGELQELPVKVAELMKQLEESQCVQVSLTQELREIHKLKSDLEEKLADSEEARRTDEDIQKELEEQLDKLAAELQSVQAQKETAMSEWEYRLQSVSNERDLLQQRIDEVSEAQGLVQSLQDEIHEEKQKLCQEEALHQQRLEELEQKMSVVSQEAVRLQLEKEEHLSSFALLKEERDQLKADLKENIEMMVEVQDELRVIQEKNKKQKEYIQKLEAAQTAQMCTPAQPEELEAQMKTFKDELELVQADNERSKEERDELVSRLSSLTEDRDRLQEALDTLTQEKEQLQQLLDNRPNMVSLQSELNQAETQEDMAILQREKEQLQASLQTVTTEKSQLEYDLQQKMLKMNVLEEELERVQADNERSKEEGDELVSRLTSLSEDRDQLQEALDTLTQEKQQFLDNRTNMVSLQNELSEAETHEDMTKLQQKIEQHQASLQTVRAEKSQLESDMQQNTQKLEETQRIVQSLEQMLQEQNQKNLDLERQIQDRATELERQTIELERVQVDSEKSKEERDELVSRLSSFNEDREQLQQALDSLTQEKQQLQHLLDNRTDMLEQLRASLQTVSADKCQLERDLQQNQQKIKYLEEELERVQADSERSKEERDELVSRLISLTEDREQLQQTLDTLTQEKQQFLDCRMDMVSLQSELNQAETQKDMAKLQHELDQLRASLQTASADKSQLENDLQQNTQKLDETQRTLQSLEKMLQEQNQKNLDLERWSQNRDTELERQTKELEHVQADIERSKEERDELVSRLSSLTEDREQLQQALDSLTQEKQQFQHLLDNRTNTLQLEITRLNESLQLVREQKIHLEEELHSNLKMVSQLNASLHDVKEEKSRLEDNLHNNLELTSQKQELLRLVQEELSEQKRINHELAQEHSSLNQQLQSLTERLQSAEVDGSTEDKKELVSRLSSLTEDREQLQQALDNSVEKVELLTKELEMLKKKEPEAQVLQLLSEANQTISNLREQLSSPPEEGPLSLLLDDSTLHLQKSFKKFKRFAEICSNNTSLKVKSKVFQTPSCFSSLPKSTVDSFHVINHLSGQALQNLTIMSENLQKYALRYQQLFEELVKKDLIVFEERRLQDVLLCRAHAPSYSIKDMDFVLQWKMRLKEVLEKRQLYLEKMDSTFDRISDLYRSELSTEFKEKERFETKLQQMCRGEPIDVSALDSFLGTEQQLRTTLLQKRNSLFKAVTEEHSGLLKELTQQVAQVQTLFEDEKSKRYTLQHGLEGAPLKTQASLIKDNQKLQVQLHTAQDHIRILSLEKEELQKAQVKAEHQVATHKEATQLLQTELQDTCAKLQERECTIEELYTRLQQAEAERNSSADIVKLAKLNNKISKLEMELQSSSENIQKLTSLLDGKETSLRRLKETLRSQQQRDEFCLEGEALHARLVQPKGVAQTSVFVEKGRLEEEARQLKLRITELESLVTSLQAEVGKWKHRALKMRNDVETKSNRELHPGSPSKRPRCDSPRKNLRSPRKALDSPALTLLNSPKSRFFDGGSSSEFLVRNCPKQFFDNSRLGTPPVAEGAADVKQDWLQWPMSPKEEEMCKKQ